MRIAVKFRAYSMPYGPGEVAFFEEKEAGRLINRGIADLVTDTPAVVADVPEVVTAEAEIVGNGDALEDETDKPARRGKRRG
jgi:hypothetical protein